MAVPRVVVVSPPHSLSRIGMTSSISVISASGRRTDTTEIFLPVGKREINYHEDAGSVNDRKRSYYSPLAGLNSCGSAGSLMRPATPALWSSRLCVELKRLAVLLRRSIAAEAISEPDIWSP